MASARLRSISAAIAAKSSSLACTAASCATRGSSRRRASSTPATSLTRIAWRLRSRSRGTSSDAHEDPAGLTAAHRENAGLGQHLHGLAQRRAADAHQRRELALGGQAVAHVQVAGLDPLGDLLDGLLEGTAR